MSDKIIACNKVMDGTDVIQYDLSYEVESGGNKNQFCVVVLAEELTNPADTAEVETKANVKAKLIKDAWVVGLPAMVSTPVTDIVGDTTLPS
jgi:hypothetical protein